MAKITGVGRSGIAWQRTGGSLKQGGGLTKQHWRLQGVENVTRNINAALMEIQNRSAAGLVSAARVVLKDADSGTSPLVPVDLENLRPNTFINAHKKPTNGDPFVRLGYNSNYAAAVHEMMESPSGKPINWSRPGSGPKFLEKSLKRNSKKILEIVKATI